MPTLREDLMDAIGRYRDMNSENAAAQVIRTEAGMVDALRYTIRADAADAFAMLVHNVLQKHGL